MARLTVCVCVCGCVPQDILPLDYALKLLFMFMEIVFRPAYVLTLPPPPTTPLAGLSLVSHSCHTIVGPFWPDYPHFVRLIVGFGFDFVASASASASAFTYSTYLFLLSHLLSLSVFFFFLRCFAIVCKASS